MIEGPSAKWNSAGTRMPSRKKPVLPGFAPRIAYSANGHTTCDTPGSDSITRNGSPPVPGVVRAASASMRTTGVTGFAATTVSKA